jgi:hypothetical protein
MEPLHRCPLDIRDARIDRTYGAPIDVELGSTEFLDAIVFCSTGRAVSECHRITLAVAAS